MSVTKLLNYGDKDVIVELVTIKTIVEEFLPVNEVYQVDSDEEDDYIEISKVTNSKVLKAIDLLQTFWLQQEEQSINEILNLNKIKDKIFTLKNNQLKQKLIKDYF